MITRRKKISGGFTLIEMVLILGIMALIATFSVANIVGIKSQKSLNAASYSVAANLRGAMENSRAGKDGSQWWIRFVNPSGTGGDYYSVCSGTYSGSVGSSCVTEGGVESSRTPFIGDVSFSTPADGQTVNVVFQRSTGLPTGSGKIVLSASGLRQAVTISSNGLVDYGDYWQVGYLGYWKFDETSGTTAYDTSINGNNGTLVGPTVGTGCKIGGCVALDGVNDQINFFDPGFSATTDFTFSIWVKFNALNSGALLLVGHTDQSHGFARSGSSVIFGIRGSGSLFSVTSPALSTGTWYNFVGTYDSVAQRVTMYMNGNLVSSTSTATLSTSDTSEILLIGNTNVLSGSGTNFLNGTVDEARVYDSVLSASEVSALYGSGL